MKTDKDGQGRTRMDKDGQGWTKTDKDGEGGNTVEIIRQGNPEKIKETKRFICSWCGCEWKADKGEYKICETYMEIQYYMDCPCCKKQIVRTEK